jgi:hypothetical protein
MRLTGVSRSVGTFLAALGQAAMRARFAVAVERQRSVAVATVILELGWLLTSSPGRLLTRRQVAE